MKVGIRWGYTQILIIKRRLCRKHVAKLRSGADHLFNNYLVLYTYQDSKMGTCELQLASRKVASYKPNRLRVASLWVCSWCVALRARIIYPIICTLMSTQCSNQLMNQSKRNKVNIHEMMYPFQCLITTHDLHLRAIVRFNVKNGNKIRRKNTQVFKLLKSCEIKKFSLRLQVFKAKTSKQCPIREGLKNHVIDVDSQQPRGYWSYFQSIT